RVKEPTAPAGAALPRGDANERRPLPHEMEVEDLRVVEARPTAEPFRERIRAIDRGHIHHPAIGGRPFALKASAGVTRSEQRARGGGSGAGGPARASRSKIDTIPRTSFKVDRSERV